MVPVKEQSSSAAVFWHILFSDELTFGLFLVGGLEHLDYFSHHIGNVIIPTDELIFFRGVAQPPTSS